MTTRCTGCLAFLLVMVFAGCARDTASPPVGTPSPPQSGGIIVVAVGDISCDPGSSKYNNGRGTERYCRMLATSDLAISLKPAAVFVLGDSQYEMGMLSAFQKAWSQNWGRPELKDITYPTPGNHEYKTKNAEGYFAFFGSRAGEAGKGYYSFDLGTWHIVSLNSGGNDRCSPVSCETGSEQEQWLRQDLSKSTFPCLLAFWHRPLFTSGRHRDATEVKPFWRNLYQAKADVILNGHSHHYERFFPQDPDGVRDPARGITQFIVGTGGKNLKRFWRAERNSVVRNSQSFGILKLELRPGSYAWQFLSENGQALDSGFAQCHAKPQLVQPEEGNL